MTIATRDNEMVSILPQVINCISKEAPGLALRVVPLVGDDLSPFGAKQNRFFCYDSH